MGRTVSPDFSFALYSGVTYIDRVKGWGYIKFPDLGYMYVMGEMIVAGNKEETVAFCYPGSQFSLSLDAQGLHATVISSHYRTPPTLIPFAGH